MCEKELKVQAQTRRKKGYLYHDTLPLWSLSSYTQQEASMCFGAESFPLLLPIPRRAICCAAAAGKVVGT